MSEKILNPKIDFAFRKLFGSDENKDLLISLINSVVEPDLRLTDVTIKNPFNLAAYRRSKETVLDIKAVDQDGVWYDIEMQVMAHILYGKRALYYLSKVYSEQLGTGDDYSSLNTTIGIHFLDFRYFDSDERIVRQFVFKDAETNEAPAELGCLRLYFVEMAKFEKEWSEIRTTLDRWIAFLNKAESLNRDTLPGTLRDDPAIVKAAVELERMGLDPEERAIYEAEVKAAMLDQIQLKTAEERGLQVGLERGMQQGIERGIQQGIERGMQQGAQHVLLHLLQVRFGEVPASVVNRLSLLSASELDDLTSALFSFTSVADVERWLLQQ